ncbi:MAG TPA: hypothetical protein PLU52_13450, partial [Opitutaceae bacterium]|nr:hypothetical protein [Opitutaceae bacterium]
QFDAVARLNEVYDAVVRLEYDIRKHRFNEQAYGFRQKISNVWLAEYTFTLYDGPRRESRVGFNVRVTALAF